MILFLLATVVGLVMLTFAADAFVEGAARLASAFRVSPVVIGAIVIGFGTSAPEMVVSGLASAQGNPDIAVGNIIGSNVANLTLVLGTASLIVLVRTSSQTVRREAPLSLGAVLLFAVLVQDGLQRWEGGVLAVALVLTLSWLLSDMRSGSEDELVEEVREFIDADWGVDRRAEVIRTVVGLVGTIVGAQLTVYGATGVADELGLAEGFVGLTLVALGTSLPELTTAVAAARKGEDELLLGNLLGSNIFNSLAVGAIAALLGPGRLDDPGLAGLPVAVMVVTALIASVFIITDRTVTRYEGTALLVGYAVVLPFLA
ncbi:MAG: calcium/sodium antiporter [Actinomycetota bacterium]